jgi:hypothetical protein
MIYLCVKTRTVVAVFLVGLGQPNCAEYLYLPEDHSMN